MRGIFFTLLLLTPFAMRADELDTLLAQPPSASFSADDARHRIEMLRGFIAAHPERADEIEAYLIPFVRVAEPPPKPAAPKPAPEPAKPKPLLLLKSADGTASTMRALSFRKQGGVVLVVGEKGSRAVLQASTIVGELPWFTDAELEGGAVNLRDTAARYEASAMVFPALAGELRREAARLRAMQQERDDAAAKERAAIEERVAQATSARYDAASGYTAASLARLLIDAEKVRRELPGFSERIDAWSEPFREHFTKLETGFSYVGGKWVSNEELARLERERQQREFMSGLDYRLGAEALPADAVRGTVAPIIVKGCFAMAAGLAVLVLGRRRRLVRVAGAGLLAVTPMAMATVFFLATRDPGLMQEKIPPAGEQQIVATLSEAAGIDGSVPQARRLSDAEINSFLARHVRIANAETKHGSVRESITLRMLPGRVIVFEMVRSMGLDWIVRFDLALKAADGAASVALEDAKLGALSCPKPLAADLWRNLEPQLAAILKSANVTKRFAIDAASAGGVDLRPAGR